MTDDYFDRGMIGREVVEGIARKLEGIDVKARNPYENAVYELIDDIFTDYPQDKHPALAQILKKLHAEQVQSMRQKSQNLPFRDIVDISVRKGGLSVLSAAYIALGGLTERQMDFFYHGGAVFQFIDDLLDVEEDVRDGIQTIWTSRLKAGEPFDEQFHRVLQLQKYACTRMPGNVADFAHPELVSKLYDVAFKGLMLRGYFVNEERFSVAARKEVTMTLPISDSDVRPAILYMHSKVHGQLLSLLRGAVEVTT